MSTGFKVTQIGNYKVDLDDVLMRRDYIYYHNLFTWGIDTGDGTDEWRSNPVTTSGGGTNWKHCFESGGIKTDGTLWSWGENYFGQLGDNSTTDKLSPVTTSGGGNNWLMADSSNWTATSAGIKTDGTLWVWGYGIFGLLGDNSTTNKSSPVTIAGGGNWKSVSVGMSSGAIKDDNTLWVWGFKGNGMLGDGSTTSVGISYPTTISGGGSWKSVSMGYGVFSGIKTDNTLWTWGTNVYRNYTQNENPEVIGMSNISGNWNQVSSGNYNYAAIKTDGTLWTWGHQGGFAGYDEFDVFDWTTDPLGQLGQNNSTLMVTSPTTVSGGGTNWKLIKSDDSNMWAIKTDGTLWGWGFNHEGSVGDNSTINKSSPVRIASQLSSFFEWKEVSVAKAILLIN